jgi:hypothetical protein
MFGELISEWPRLTEAISELHNEPVFLPESYIKGTLLPAVFMVAITLTIFYLITFQFVDKIVPADADAIKKSKVCYQITNICFNLCVGSLGLYIEYWVLPSLPVYNGSSVDKILGLVDETYLLSALQLGYQMWAIPVGIFYVHESSEMILHHLAVVVATSMSGFLTVGFRYYISFFYGVMELSSLPLSVMNVFKDNPEWKKKHPKAFEISRNVFAISFLWIRVYLCAYRWPIFLRDNFIVMYTREMGIHKVYLFVQWSLASLLAYFQLFWASLILKGFLKLIFPAKGDAKKSKKE